MTKQPTRLADFPIPRSAGADVDGTHTDQPAAVPHAMLAPAPAAPPSLAPTLATLPETERPPEIPRRALGARVPVPLAERLRAYLYVSRRSQQEVVEAALDDYLRERGA